VKTLVNNTKTGTTHPSYLKEQSLKMVVFVHV